MAVANTKSTIVTNADAAVQTLTQSALSQGKLYSGVATLEVAAADDDNSVYRFFRVHSSWRIHRIWLLCDAITGGTAYHVGLHQIASAGGAAAAASAYASSVDISTAKVAAADVAFEARNIDTIGQQVWQDAGASADTDRWYDLTMTGATAGTAAGTISLGIEYTTGGS